MATRNNSVQTTRKQLQDRGISATKNLREALDLPSGLDDTSILGTALAEAAIDECRRNPRFIEDIRRRYGDMMELQESSAPRLSKQKEPLPPLVPIGRVSNFVFDPYAPPNPQFLIQVYGNHQLARALHDYTADQLKQTAAAIEARLPGTKPTNRGRKDALISYIVEYSAKE